MLNGIPARGLAIYEMNDVRPWYEEQFINGIRTVAQTGDTVLLIGAGFGVSSIRAAEVVGPRGVIHAYEASGRRVNWIKETLELNDMRDQVEVHHAIVGENVSVNGRLRGAERIDPSDLPEADVLALDIEGAEFSVLDSISNQPRGLVVEFHPQVGPPDVVDRYTKKLVNSSYTIEHRGVEMPELGIEIIAFTK